MNRQYEIGQTIFARAGIITNGGIEAEVVKITPCQIEVKVKDMFFPIHRKPDRPPYQVAKPQQEFAKERIIGKVFRFWTQGSREGLQVGTAHNWHSRGLISKVEKEALEY